MASGNIKAEVTKTDIDNLVSSASDSMVKIQTTSRKLQMRVVTKTVPSRSATSYTFSPVLPNACLAVIPMVNTTDNKGQANISVSGIGTSGFTAYNYNTEAASASVKFLVIGY